MILEIFALLKKICYKLGLIRDYVVDYGTSGIWTYIKWQSGIAMCWGRQTYTQAGNFAAWGTDFCSNAIAAQKYPFTFQSIPFEKVHVTSPVGSGWADGYDNSTTYTGKVQIVRPASGGGTVVWTLNYLAIGLWKPLEKLRGGVVKLLNLVRGCCECVYTPY